MQTASFKIWTQVTDSISYNNGNYIKCTSSVKADVSSLYINYAFVE